MKSLIKDTAHDDVDIDENIDSDNDGAVEEEVKQS